jgi:hypothetical protein
MIKISCYKNSNCRTQMGIYSFLSSFYAWLSYMAPQVLSYIEKKKLSFLFMFDFFILGLFGAGHYENEGLCKCTILSA